MKKLLISIVILICFAFILMASTLKTETKTTTENPPPCWSTVTVSWWGNCVFPDDNTIYVVKLTIWDECDDPYTKVYDSTKYIQTNYTSTTFCIQNAVCNLDIHDDCMHVIATVAKVNVNTQVVICSGLASSYTNCAGLMGTYNTGNVHLN